MPGSWKKYYEGGFDEPGLGGRDTPVLSGLGTGADAIFPQVSYAEALGEYLMVFNLNYYRELAAEGPARSGIYTAVSTDGVHWSPPTQVLRAYAVAQTDREVAWHPTILWDGKGQPGGWLVYGYSPRWGHGGGRKAHYLAGQRIVFGRAAATASP